MLDYHYVKSDFNTRIACICETRTAYIMLKDIPIATISEERNDAYEFDWVIRIIWENWEKAGESWIAGIDHDLHLDEYIRANVIPSFVEQRTMPDTRDNLWEELDRVGLDYNDRFEFMCRTHGLCGPSILTVCRVEEVDDSLVPEKYRVSSTGPLPTLE